MDIKKTISALYNQATNRVNAAVQKAEDYNDKARNIAAHVIGQTIPSIIRIGGAVADIALAINTSGESFFVLGSIGSDMGDDLAKKLESYSIKLRGQDPKFIGVRAEEQKKFLKTSYIVYGIVYDPANKGADNRGFVKYTEQQASDILGTLNDNEMDRVETYLSALKFIQYYKLQNDLKIETNMLLVRKDSDFSL